MKSTIISILTLAGAVAAVPAATTTTSANPNSATPSTCPTSGVKYYIKASGSGTAADGTYMQGVASQPSGETFNAFANYYGISNTIQAYYPDPNTNFWFDGVFYLCVDHSSNNPHTIFSCMPTQYNNGKTSPLTCTQNLYGGSGSKAISCTTNGSSDGVTWDTFFVNNVASAQQGQQGQVEQVLSIGTAAQAASMGKKVTLTPERATNCGL